MEVLLSKPQGQFSHISLISVFLVIQQQDYTVLHIYAALNMQFTLL